MEYRPDFELDFMTRTRQIVDEYHGHYEATLQVNCLVGLLMLPKERNAIVSLEAAKTTLQRKGRPQPGSEAEDAMRSIESRQISAERDLREQMDLLFAGVRVFQAGGQEVSVGSELSDKVNYAAKASVARLYNEFGTADQANWGKALEEARKGNQECLKAIGYEREVDQHPVCAKLLAFIGPGKKGAEIRDNFNAPP